MDVFILFKVVFCALVFLYCYRGVVSLDTFIVVVTIMICSLHMEIDQTCNEYQKKNIYGVEDN